ncbi:MAG: endonuclease domain-containing protein [Bacteroidia bacterium]|nr:endonuclease domain-containing protein [Bacteroidia bacterium]
MTTYHHYNKKLKPFATQNRKESTKAEIRLWCELLRNKQMMGHNFLRQRPIENYIADFFCKKLKLIIECDGYSHQLDEVAERDEQRTKRLTELGYHVIRFSDNEVMNNIENVKRTIEGWIEMNR